MTKYQQPYCIAHLAVTKTGGVKLRLEFSATSSISLFHEALYLGIWND